MDYIKSIFKKRFFLKHFRNEVFFLFLFFQEGERSGRGRGGKERKNGGGIREPFVPLSFLCLSGYICWQSDGLLKVSESW